MHSCIIFDRRADFGDGAEKLRHLSGLAMTEDGVNPEVAAAQVSLGQKWRAHTRMRIRAIRVVRARAAGRVRATSSCHVLVCARLEGHAAD